MNDFAQNKKVDKKKHNDAKNKQLGGFVQDDLVLVDPQPTFLTNCRYTEQQDNLQEYCVLAWNLVGTVILRRQVRFTSIDVEFQDKSMHRNFSLNDDFNCSMASLNYSGLVIASQGEFQDLDKYEEDDDEDQEMGN